MTMPRYSLRTLLILMAIGPPLLAAGAVVAANWDNMWLGFWGMLGYY